MTGPTHILIGISSGIGFSYATSISPSLAQLLLLVIGSIAPDIDGNGMITRPGKRLKKVLPSILSKILDLIFINFGRLVNLLFGHRGFTHWPILAIGVIAYSMVNSHPLLFWFGLGYLSHILGDFLTTEGVPMLAPISKKRFNLTEMKTGSTAEIIVAILLCFVIAVYGPKVVPVATQDTLELFHNYVNY